eukprot:TRINITY_DN1050_c0_g1_i2.p4 TRINITY_DN1050_c0_g1~~TRINITY_DN1050_c0_g1_i2.p4  ORF type:complete len:109 (+),score=15.02 TRINITY_DN1050_c0_g1_i2:1301-1627(+)
MYPTRYPLAAATPYPTRRPTNYPYIVSGPWTLYPATSYHTPYPAAWSPVTNYPRVTATLRPVWFPWDKKGKALEHADAAQGAAAAVQRQAEQAQARKGDVQTQQAAAK